MAKGDGLKYVKKAYTILSLLVVAVIWIAFGVHFGIQGHGPHEANWFEEVMKWVVMTPILVVLVDCIAYALIMTNAARKEHDLDRPFWEEFKEFFNGKLDSLKTLKESAAEEIPAVEEPVIPEAVEPEVAPEEVAPVKKTTRKKKVAEE